MRTKSKLLLKSVTSLVSLSAMVLAMTMVGQSSANAAGASCSKEVTFFLVRHGETTANVMHLAQGWSDFTLTDNGIEGAKYLGLGLKKTTFKAAYSGDLTRQEKTAREALRSSGNQKVRLQIDTKLRECNYGSYEGRPDSAQNIPDIAKHFGYNSSGEFFQAAGKSAMNKMQDGYYELDKQNALNTELPKPYRAESSGAVEKRMTASLTKIAKDQANKGGGNVLVVSSGMSLSLFISTLNSPQYKAEPMKNDAVTKVIYKQGKFTVSGDVGSLKYFNDGKKASSK